MKKFLTFLLLIFIVLSLCSCNYNTLDFTYEFDYAYIKLPNGDLVEGKITSWRDFEDGDQLQVTVNGKTYLVHSMNCVLVKYGEQI